MKEQVLCLPSETCKIWFAGEFIPIQSSSNLVTLNLVIRGAKFLDRASVEDDENQKQIIPYIVIRHGDKYLITKRTKGQTESRLHDKYSLGLGGHVNPVDAAGTVQGTIRCAMLRELREEIAIPLESYSIVGVINDYSGPVERVHLGIVYLVTAITPDFKILEPDKHESRWATIAEIEEKKDNLERWASIIFERIKHEHSIHGEKAWQGK